MLQPYDLLMLAVVVGAMLLGVWKGMAWQIAALASVMVSAAVAIRKSACPGSLFRHPRAVESLPCRAGAVPSHVSRHLGRVSVGGASSTGCN